ncbi:hypothetical protein MASR2M78_21140 [Treponema sp.]
MQRNFWQINDMTVKDGVLYISASQIYASSGHSDPRTSQSGGKVIALSTANLSKLGSDIGWHGDGVSFPTDPNKNTQFYGPGRSLE